MSDGPLLNERWHLDERLGGGAQGRTFLARDIKADEQRIVVIKQLRLGSKTNTTWKQFDLFEREVRVLRALSHPAIPKYIDHFESEPGVFNLVMERSPGKPLSTKDIALDQADLREILRQLLEVLRYLHALKPPVIHRDIKPANIIRSDDGAVALVDFGGVRAAVRDKGGSTVVGTFGYMAPEQLHGQATAATDLYGLGATIVALIGGVEPEDVPRRGLRMDLRKHLDGVDRHFVRLLEWLTEPNPDDRPQSANEVIDKLGPDAKKALATIAPDRITSNHGEDNVIQDAVEFLDTLPRPLAVVARMLLFIIGIGGYLSVVVTRVTLLPLLFGIISVFSSDSFKPKLETSRKTTYKAVADCMRGFKVITGMSRKPKRLPSGDDGDRGDGDASGAYRR